MAAARIAATAGQTTPLEVGTNGYQEVPSGTKRYQRVPRTRPTALANNEAVGERLARAFTILVSSGALGQLNLTLEEKLVWAYLRADREQVTQRDICDLFGIPRAKMIRVMQRLVRFKLLKETRVGLGQPNRRYAQPLDAALIGDRHEGRTKQLRAIVHRSEEDKQPQAGLFDRAELDRGLGILTHLGVNFTPRQITQLQSIHGPVFVTIVCAWAELHELAARRFGPRAAAIVARFLRDGQGPPADLVPANNSAKPLPYRPSRREPPAERPTLDVVSSDAHAQATAMGLQPGTPQYTGFVRQAQQS